MPHTSGDSVFSGLGEGVIPTTVHTSSNGSVDIPINNQLSFISEIKEMELDKIYAVNELVSNINLSRRELFSAINDPRRDIAQECHFPTAPLSSGELKQLYDEESIAARVVEVLPKQCFQVTPEVTESEDGEEETEFEKAWHALGRSLLPDSWLIKDDATDPESAMFKQEQGSPIWRDLLLADILSGIGPYGVIFFGIDDELDFSQPAKGIQEFNSFPGERPESGELLERAKRKTDKQYDGTYDDRTLYTLNKCRENPYVLNRAKNLIKNRKLRYLRVLPASQAEIVAYETNLTSPRYGYPTAYRITFNEYGKGNTATSGPTGTYTVHWSRVQHIADWYHTADSSRVLAKSRMEPVLRELLSIRKPMHASAEGYWKTCMTILIGEFMTQDGTKPPVNAEGMKSFFWKLQNSLQRTGWLENGTLKSIAPTVTDPTPFVDVLVKSICRKLNIPVPVFDGYEIGEQASENNQVNWNKELANRQNIYITPDIIIPFITRLVMLGVLPRPKGLRIKWPDLDSMTKAQQGALAQSRTAALAQYTQAGVTDWFPPHEFLTRELGYDDEVAEAILEAGEEYALDKQEKDIEQQHRMIDEGLSEDPQATPDPSPITVKPGDKVVDPKSGKKIAEGKPQPKPVIRKPVRNKEKKVKVKEPQLTTNSTLNQFSQRLSNWFWTGKK